MNKSLSIIGKSWILPCGRLINVSMDEHARYARAVMLNIPEAEVQRAIPLPEIFKPLDRMQVVCALARGASVDAVSFLKAGERVDPRVYAIEKLDWIRVNGNNFYANQWHQKNLSRVIDNREFWKLQPNATESAWICLHDLNGPVNEGTRPSLARRLETVCL